MRSEGRGNVRTSVARRGLLLGYLAILAFALLAPFSFRWDGGFLAERLGRLLSIGTLTPGDAVDAARNVLLLAGWGLLEVVTDAGRSRRRRVVAALAGGAAIGVTAELVQLALPPRIPSLLDASMNTAGAGLGALAADAARRALDRGRRRPTALGVPGYALAVPYVLALLLEAAFPLLRNEGAGLSSGGPLARTAWAIGHFSWESLTVLPVLDVFLFLPGGLLMGAALWEWSQTRERAAGLAAVCGVAVAVLGELLHAPLGVPIEVGPVLVHAGGFAVGAWLGVRLIPGWLRQRRGGERHRDVLGGFLLVLLLWRLRPFVPELDPAAIAAELSPSRWSPLSALGARRDLYSVSDVLRSFLLFAPVGAVLAARESAPRSGDRWGSLRSPGWILGLAFVLEAGQALVGARFFDGTDILVMAAGGVVAWSLVRARPKTGVG